MFGSSSTTRMFLTDVIGTPVCGRPGLIGTLRHPRAPKVQEPPAYPPEAPDPNLSLVEQMARMP